MSGSKSLAVTRSGGHALDAPLAALAGLAVAFLAFTAPAGLLGDIVAATGLPSLLPAASPPLGFNARLGLASAGAVAVFASVFLLLRWLGRSPQPRAEEEARPAETPRVRRRDFHPDARTRPPLLAAAELGEPAAETQDAEPPEPVAPDESGFEPVAQDESGFAPEWQSAEEPGDCEPPPCEALEIEPEPVTETEVAPEPEPQIPVAAAPPSWLPEPQAEAARPSPSPPPPLLGTSIAELMERLEHGLARRRNGGSVARGHSDPPLPDPADDRLQSAIDSLQRLAARQR